MPLALRNHFEGAGDQISARRQQHVVARRCERNLAFRLRILTVVEIEAGCGARFEFAPHLPQRRICEVGGSSRYIEEFELSDIVQGKSVRFPATCSKRLASAGTPAAAANCSPALFRRSNKRELQN